MYIIIYPYKYPDYIYIDKYIYIIYMFKFSLFADICGRSGPVVTHCFFTAPNCSGLVLRTPSS